jgi:hypothetical protein
MMMQRVNEKKMRKTFYKMHPIMMKKKMRKTFYKMHPIMMKKKMRKTLMEWKKS